MPLKLVTGPANSAKAGEVLGGYRARLDEEPVLVVPEFRDVEHAQREMAANGAVFGVRVARFGWLWGLIARRVGYSARVASSFQRELLVAEAVERAELRVLAPSARQPGFSRAAARFLAEVGRAGIEPDEFGAALSQWAGSGPRRAYASEIAQIHSGYRAALERAGLVDRELFAWRTLDAFRENPGAWGATPVFVYGFDDFTEVELAGIEVLAEHVDVALSFPYEPGRHAFDALSETFERLAARADEHVELEGVPDHYEPASRAPLHHLERRLFDPTDERLEAGSAVRFHSAGGERAEVELAAASVLEQLAAGTPAGDIAVVFRSPERYASLVDQVFSAYGIPFSLDRRIRARTHPARPRPARAVAVRAARARRHHRRPPHLPALARPPRRARAGGPARGEGAPEGSARCGRGAEAVGGGQREAVADGDRRSARRRRRHGEAPRGARAPRGVAFRAAVPASRARLRPRRGRRAADLRRGARRARTDAHAR